MNDDTADRLQKLEAHIAHLEYQLDQLNEVVVDQGRVVERLKREVQRQSEAIETQELERIKANNQKPPHYQ